MERWFRLYREEGLDASLKRNYSGGRPPKLTEEIVEALDSGLRAGRWNTAVQTQRELESRFGRSFPYRTVLYWLKNCAGVMRVPRPAHEKRDPKKAEAFKRSLLAILKALPVDWSKPRIVWFADESRYGLLPNLRRCWTLKGLRPVKRWLTRYQWSYCYGAIDPVEGRSVFVQTPSVNMDWTEAFLLEIKKAYPDHEHVVVWDGAGFHPKSSEHEKVPDGVHVVALPPYSPELNPIEKLWDCVQDFTANKLWPSIERLDQAVGEIPDQRVVDHKVGQRVPLVHVALQGVVVRLLRPRPLGHEDVVVLQQRALFVVDVLDRLGVVDAGLVEQDVGVDHAALGF